MSEAKVQPKQFHIEVVVGSIHDPAKLAAAIEDAYQMMNDQALADQMVIVNTTQTCVMGETILAVVLTSHRLSRATIREMEMRQEIGQRVPPIKPVRSS